MKNILFTTLGFAILTAYSATAAIVVNATEDVMTSSFFMGANTVRGYIGDSRPTFRVSTENPFGLAGAETVYLSFTAENFAGMTETVSSAKLTLTSVAGGQNADATSANPFLVSAHGVNANPFTSITDDTNPTGGVSWQSFYNNNILAASTAARTSINGFGQFEFDVTDLVNSWITGANSNYFIAMTGKYDTSGNNFLHGFSNSSDTGSTTGISFLTLETVPEPSSALFAVASLGLLLRRRR